MTLVTTSKPGSVRSRGVQGDRVLDLHQQLRRLIERRTGDLSTAAFFAEPRFDAASGAISWYTESSGNIAPISSLDSERRRGFDAMVDEIVTEVGAVIADLEASEQADQRVVAERLRAALVHPAEDDLYLVGDQPVLVNWSCESALGGTAPVDLIGRVRKPIATDSVAQAKSPLVTGVPSDQDKIIYDQPTKTRFGWGWLGWLLAFLVLLALAWLLYWQDRLHVQEPNADQALLEEEIALHKERDTLRQQLFDEQMACASEECPGGRISGVKWEDSNGNGQRDAGEPGLPSITVFIDSNGDATLDANEARQVTDAEGKYAFQDLPRGRYEIHEVVPPEYLQTYPADPSRPGDGLADVILEFFDGGNGPLRGPYGSNGGPPQPYKGKYSIESVEPEVVLQPSPPPPVVGSNKAVKWLALPEGSYVVVGFVDERIIDGPGEDIFIQSFDKKDSANENADIFVSSDGKTFTFLGKVNELGTVKLDLASIGFKRPVKAVKVVGLDELGKSPGFDLVSVRGLPGSVVTPGHHTVDLEENGVVRDIDFGNQPQQQSKPEPAPEPKPKLEPEPKVTSGPRPATEYCPEEKIVPPTLALVYDNSGSMAFPLNMPKKVSDRYWEQYNLYLQKFAQRQAIEALGQLFTGRNPSLESTVGHLSGSEWVDQNLKDELRKYGPKRVDVAKPLIEKLIRESPADSALGLVAFSACDNIAKRFSAAGATRDPLLRLVRNLKPDGSTPIARSLSAAGSIVDGTSADKPAIIVLVTDGEESCNANPCAVAQSIKQSKPWAVVHVVKMGPEGSSNCVAEATGGKVYQPTSADELAAAIKEARITAPFELGCRE